VLDIDDTKTTNAGLNELQKALPACWIRGRPHKQRDR